jgi:hypothetical protein
MVPNQKLPNRITALSTLKPEPHVIPYPLIVPKPCFKTGLYQGMASAMPHKGSQRMGFQPLLLQLPKNNLV